MDYNERYEEAKKLYKTANDNQKYVLERLFPELKESGDEKTRKNIKIALMSVKEELADFYSTHHTSQEEFLAWLEKQGEQNMIEALRIEYEKGRADVITEMKSSWDEEDEEMFNGIILRCEKYGYQEQINWLKSRIYNNHWKPTKEQMYMLEWLTTNVLDDGVVGNKAKEVLYTLIEQLKSL